MTTSIRTHLAVLPLLFVLLWPGGAHASTTDGTIDGVSKYAWSNNAGWINFAASSGSAHVTDSGLTGYAWSSNYGWINLAPTNGGVTNDGEGTLGGFAWGASLGWISFAGVTIDTSGHFHGAATGLVIGTLTFDCASCAVATDWRPLSVRAPAPVVPSGGGGGGGGGGGANSNLVAIPGLPLTGSCAYSSTGVSADITKDGVVDIFDFNALLVAWDIPGAQSADITRDCVVDILDFNALMVGWSL